MAERRRPAELRSGRAGPGRPRVQPAVRHRDAALRVELYAAAYAAAVEDLDSGFDAAVVVETRPPFAEAWARTLAALRDGNARQRSPPAKRPRPRLRRFAPRHVRPAAARKLTSAASSARTA